MGCYGGCSAAAIAAVNPDARLIRADGDRAYRATPQSPLNGEKAETGGAA